MAPSAAMKQLHQPYLKNAWLTTHRNRAKSFRLALDASAIGQLTLLAKNNTLKRRMRLVSPVHPSTQAAFSFVDIRRIGAPDRSSSV